MKLVRNLLLLFFLLVSPGMTSNLFAQSHAEEEHHEFKRFMAAVNIGHSYSPGASFEGKDYFGIIPAWGLDLQFWFNRKWGLALKGDIEIARYTLEDKGTEEVLERENPKILSLPVLFRPFEEGLTFLLGPGIEFDAHHNFNVLRFGVGYEFEFPGHWGFAPELVYDLKDAHYNAFTIAIGVGKRF